MTLENKKKRLILGKVVSKKMQKTSTVEVDIVVRNKFLNKTIRHKKKYHVHDPKEESQIGNMIEFYEGIPVSKTKFMHFFRIVDNKKLFTNELDSTEAIG